MRSSLLFCLAILTFAGCDLLTETGNARPIVETDLASYQAQRQYRDDQIEVYELLLDISVRNEGDAPFYLETCGTGGTSLIYDIAFTEARGIAPAYARRVWACTGSPPLKIGAGESRRFAIRLNGSRTKDAPSQVNRPLEGRMVIALFASDCEDFYRCGRSREVITSNAFDVTVSEPITAAVSRTP